MCRLRRKGKGRQSSGPVSVASESREPRGNGPDHTAVWGIRARRGRAFCEGHAVLPWPIHKTDIESSNFDFALKLNHANGSLSEARYFDRRGRACRNCGVYILPGFDCPIADLAQCVAGPDENLRGG